MCYVCLLCPCEQKETKCPTEYRASSMDTDTLMNLCLRLAVCVLCSFRGSPTLASIKVQRMFAVFNQELHTLKKNDTKLKILFVHRLALHFMTSWMLKAQQF